MVNLIWSSQQPSKVMLPLTFILHLKMQFWGQVPEQRKLPKVEKTTYRAKKKPLQRVSSESSAEYKAVHECEELFRARERAAIQKQVEESVVITNGQK